MMTESTPAIGMIRVSSKKQDKQGYSPAEQREAIQRYADDHGLRIVEFVNEAKTGFTLDRADVRRMREMARQGTIKAVVAFVMDRLSRDLELQISLRREITRLGLALYTTTRGRIEDNPEANLLSNIEGAFSQHEIETLVRRSKMGRMGKAKSGKYVGVGNPPYGGQKIGERREATIVPDPKTIKIVHKIFDWYTGWTGEKPIGLIPICERLMEQHIAAPYGGTRWWPATVSGILKSRAYIGVLEYRGIEIPTPAMAVIERRQWNAAQRQCEQNTIEADRNRKREYLMARRLTCACGQASTAVTRYKSDRVSTTAIYFCSTRGQPKGLYAVCHFGTITVSKVDSAIWAYLKAKLTPEALRAGALEADAYEAGAPVEQGADRLAAIDADIKQHTQQIEALFTRFGNDADAELAAQAELRIREVRQQILGLRSEREDLLANADRAQATADQRADAIERIHKLGRKIERATFVVKRQVIDILDVRAKFGRHENGQRFAWITSLLSPRPELVEFD